MGVKNWLDFILEMKLISVLVEIDLGFVRGAKKNVFSVRTHIDLNFVWVVQINLISVQGIELDLIPV